MQSFQETVFLPASGAFGRQCSVPEAVLAVRFVAERFAFWRWPLGAFSGFSDLFECFDRDHEPSGLVPASHVRVEALKSMFLLEGSDLFREVEVLASLSEIACDLVQLHFAHGMTARWKRPLEMLSRT